MIIMCPPEQVQGQKDHEKLKANMSDADKKMWDHFDDWNHRMNQKTKVRAGAEYVGVVMQSSSLRR